MKYRLIKQLGWHKPGLIADDAENVHVEEFARLKEFWEPITEPNQEELWNECYDKLDELAREVDEFDFGLPMFEGSRKNVLDPIKSLYTLSRK